MRRKHKTARPQYDDNRPVSQQLPSSSSFHPAKRPENSLSPTVNVIPKPMDHENVPKKRPAPLPPKTNIEHVQARQDSASAKQTPVIRNCTAKELTKCQEILQEGVKDATKYHGEIMQRFIGTNNGVYKEKHIKEYHAQTSETVTKAFRQSINGLRRLKQRKVDEAIEEAANLLHSQMQSNLVVYQRKHEIATENCAKDIKMHSIHAENTYHNYMDSCEKKTKEELQKRHNEAKIMAEKELKSILEKKGFYTKGNMAELEERLKESFDTLSEEWEVANPNFSNQIAELNLIQLHDTLPNPDRHLCQMDIVTNAPLTDVSVTSTTVPNGISLESTKVSNVANNDSGRDKI